MRGEADTSAIVTVNENPTWRNGEYFYGGDYADNTAVPVFKEVEVAAVVPAATPDGWDEMSAVTGRVFVAQNPEQFTYDADGNMLTDGRFRYTWNAENRLVRAQELVAPTNRHPYTVSYAYDHKGRMVSKRITENDGQDTLVKSIAYLWDGWNIIREIVRDGGESATVTDNIWGLDLDGTLQGAGGVGGLLAVQRSDCATTNSAFCILHSALYLPTYDANGNISEYVSTNGEIVAHYDYSPFGEPLIEAGDLASTFTHRFSTKPWCSVTRLYEYQMRKYRPGIGRWLSRDPIGIKGGMNIYQYCGNRCIQSFDKYGLRVKVVGDENGLCGSCIRASDVESAFNEFLTNVGGTHAKEFLQYIAAIREPFRSAISNHFFKMTFYCKKDCEDEECKGKYGHTPAGYFDDLNYDNGRMSFSIHKNWNSSSTLCTTLLCKIRRKGAGTSMKNWFRAAIHETAHAIGWGQYYKDMTDPSFNHLPADKKGNHPDETRWGIPRAGVLDPDEERQR